MSARSVLPLIINRYAQPQNYAALRLRLARSSRQILSAAQHKWMRLAACEIMSLCGYGCREYIL